MSQSISFTTPELMVIHLYMSAAIEDEEDSLRVRAAQSALAKILKAIRKD